MDPLDYHKFAQYLAKRLWKPGSPNAPDDLYQIAMIGLLELWRDRPDADPSLCRTTMRRAILREIRAATRRKRTAELAPIEEARTVAAPDRTEETAVARVHTEDIKTLIEELPDQQFLMLNLSMMGANMREYVRENGLSRFTAQQALRDARAYLRRRLEETA